jgi:hypothetical protein
MIVVEVPLPWPEDFAQARGMPPGLSDVVMAMDGRHPDAGMVAVAPDPVLSRAGWSRMIELTYPPAPHAAARRRELLVERDQVARVVAALLDGKEVAASAGIEPVAYAGRDLLVCTHGTVDACCALFGYPLYRDLRKAAGTSNDCRVWRSTHFGGHRFAPTVLDLPDGRYWGYLTAELGAMLIRREGGLTALRGSYRGWAGYEEPAAQVLEREALVREGWAWTDWPQECAVLARNESGAVLLRITAYPPSSLAVAYEGWVEETGTVETLTETDGEPVQMPMLRVRDVRRTPADGRTFQSAGT